MSSEQPLIAPAAPARARRRELRGPTRVALAVGTSRVFGLVREAVVAALFGVTGHADVLGSVFRGPNLLQNLLGEQALSASFVPVYTRLLERGDREGAGRLAGAVLGLLALVAGGLSLLGILLARPMIALTAPGFLGDAARIAAGEATVDRYELAVAAVRFTFPMAAFIVLAGWSVGILNSHRRFFLPYVAPVVWNLAIITTAVTAAQLLAPTGWDPASSLGVSVLDRVLIAVCAGALVGGALQFAVQLPVVFRLLRGFRFSFSRRVTGVAETLRAFGPLLAARGALQLSAYIDLVLASLLTTGAIAALRWGSTLYMLPMSLFVMSVAVAELPELSRQHSGGREDRLVERTRTAIRQTCFLIFPTLVGYLAFGYLLVGAVYRRGQFSQQDNWLVYLVVACYTLGAPAIAGSRMLQNAFYAMGETKLPARIVMIRFAVSAAIGAALMFRLDSIAVADLVAVGPDPQRLYLGAIGLALGSSIAVWMELLLMRRALGRRLAGFELPIRDLRRMMAHSLAGAVPAALVAWLLRGAPLLLQVVLVVGVLAAAYIGLARWTGAPELALWLGRVSRHGEPGPDRGRRER